MIQLKVDKYLSLQKMETIFRTTTIKNMRMVAELLKLPVKTSLKKDQLAETLATDMMLLMELWLPHLPLFELKLLKKLIDHPKDKGLVVDDFCFTTWPLIITEVHLCMAYYREETHECVLYLSCEEVRKRLTEALPMALAWHESNPKEDEFMKVGMGLLNMHGLMPYIDFVEQMRRFFPNNLEFRFLFERDLVFQSLCTDIVFRAEGEADERVKMIRTPMISLETVDYILDEQEERPDLQFDYSTLTKEKLLAYGHMPYLKPYTKEERDFYDYLKKRLCMPSYNVEMVYAQLYVNIQTSQSAISAINMLNDFTICNSMEDLMQMTDQVTWFSNSIPKWILFGQSSEEVQRKSSRPAQPQYYQKDDFMAVASQLILPTPTPKVGRNDPCPCGSGKKYKKCCGK